MKETLGEGSVSRIVLVLGFLSVFILLLYQGTGIQGPPTPFNPVYPSFNDPFKDRFGVTLTPDGDNLAHPPASVSNSGLVADCTVDITTWFGCVNTLDGSDSYVTLNSTRQVFWVNLSRFSAASNLPALRFTVHVQCKALSGDTVLNFGLNDNAGSFLVFDAVDPKCRAGDWQTLTVETEFAVGLRNIGDFLVQMALTTASSSPFNVAISFVDVSLEWGPQPLCTSGDTLAYIGCEIFSGLMFAWNFIRLCITIGLYIGAWIVTVGQFLGNIAAVIVWLYAIPGMPVEIQLFLDAALTAMMGVLFFKMAGLVRGTGIGL